MSREPIPIEVAPTTKRPKDTTRRNRRSLPGGMPRRFPDHRTRAAVRYRDAYAAVVEAFPPRDRLGRFIAGMTADMMVEYQLVRGSHKKGARSRRRKLTGLLYGAFREMRNVSRVAAVEGDLNHELTRLMEERPR